MMITAKQRYTLFIILSITGPSPGANLCAIRCMILLCACVHQSHFEVYHSSFSNWLSIEIRCRPMDPLNVVHWFLSSGSVR